MRRVEKVVSGKWSRVAVGALRAELESAIRAQVEAALGEPLAEDAEVTAPLDGAEGTGLFRIEQLVGVSHRERAGGQEMRICLPDELTVGEKLVGLDLDALEAVVSEHHVPEDQETDKEKRERLQAEVASKKEAQGGSGDQSALQAALQRIDQLEQRVAAMERRGAGNNEPRGG